MYLLTYSLQDSFSSCLCVVFMRQSLCMYILYVHFVCIFCMELVSTISIVIRCIHFHMMIFIVLYY